MEDTMKTVSLGQVTEIAARFLKDTDWGALEHDVLQTEVVELSPAELGRRMTAFLRNGCRFLIKGPGSLFIDRTKAFDPVAFIGTDGDIVEQDERALMLTEIDFSKVRFESGLQDGETAIIGEVKLERLKALPEIRLDARIGQALHEEKGQTTLRWLYDTYSIAWLELAGTVLRDSDGDRYFLYLGRSGGGKWYRTRYWLGRDRYRGHVSPLLES